MLAADKFGPGQLRDYLTRFGLGQRTDIGVRGETAGLLPSLSQWTHQIQDRIAFGQSLSVNARADGRGGQHDRQRRRAGLARA